MRYLEVRPYGSLGRHVDCFWFLSGARDAAAPAQKVLPDGRVELVLHLADPFLRHAADGPVERQKRALAAGQLEEHVVLEPSGRVDVVARVPLPPGEMSRFGLLGRAEPRARKARIGFSFDNLMKQPDAALGCLLEPAKKPTSCREPST